MEKNEIYAAIALALHEYRGNNVHDKETGVITIKQMRSDWGSRILTMTEHP
ncbi:MAG: hypothetical protein Q4D41_10565 [Prevotellaceae bacterium]|nr:hypothetical protein [Prevotellaceae bacterium]